MRYDVTIGIPVFNSEAFIKRALESALSQSYPSIEFLLIDDAGDDASLCIIKEVKQRSSRCTDIRIISHEKNLGVSASRNQIIDEAKGDYLYFMDSDDVIVEDTISLLMKNSRQYDAEIVFGSYERIELSGEKTVYQYPSLQLFGENELASYAYRKYAGIQASACNYLVNTSILREHNHRFIDTNYWEDYVFTFDLVTLVSRAVLLPDITYSYLCRNGSLSNYQQRKHIPKAEILRNVYSIGHLKKTSSILYNKEYFPNRCFNIAMTDFYIVCNILKRRKDIHPRFSNKEIKTIMQHPATWSQICNFKHARMKNILLYVVGKLPSSICVATIWSLGKLKKIV